MGGCIGNEDVREGTGPGAPVRADEAAHRLLQLRRRDLLTASVGPEQDQTVYPVGIPNRPDDRWWPPTRNPEQRNRWYVELRDHRVEQRDFVFERPLSRTRIAQTDAGPIVPHNGGKLA